VVVVEARDVSRRHRDAFDLTDVGASGVAVVATAAREFVAVSDGLRRIRFDVVAGTVCAGPVRLHYRLQGFDGIEAKILTLHRLAALRRSRRFTRGLFPRERLASRWIMALRAYDALSAGANQRDVAACLLQADGSAWGAQSEFLRLRVQRLIRIGRTLVAGGYRQLLP